MVANIYLGLVIIWYFGSRARNIDIGVRVVGLVWGGPPRRVDNWVLAARSLAPVRGGRI